MIKFNYQLTPVIVGASIALAQPQITPAQSQIPQSATSQSPTLQSPAVQTSAVQSSVEVGKIAKGITVLIQGKSSNSQGSGVIVKKYKNTYTVITAAHVFGEGDKYEIITPDNQRYTINYSDVKKLKNVDLASVKFTSKQNYNVATLGNSDVSTEGATSYVAGFIAIPGDAPTSNYRFIEGKVTANSSQPDTSGYSLVYSNDTLEGMSGGPVLNEKGEVIGIHGRGYDATPEVYNVNPSIAKVKRASNSAIAINTFLQMSSKLGVNIDKTPSKTIAAVANTPKSDDFYVKGLSKYQKADYPGAIEHFSAAIQINPKASKLFVSRGNAHFEMKDYKEAIADYTQAIQINPQSIDALLSRGNANYYSGDLQAAYRDYEETIRLDPNNANAFNNRGRVKMNQRNLKAALSDFNQSIRLNPKFAGAYNNRGNARRLLGELHGVMADFNRALALNPKYAEAYYSRGLVRYGMGEAQLALADYNTSIGLDPNFAPVYVSRGNVRNELGDKPGAIEDYTQAIRLDSNLTLAYLSRGNVRNDLGDQKGAIEDYTQGIKLEPKLASAYDRRGMARALTGDRQGGLADLQQAVDLFYQQGNRELYQRTLEKIRLIERYSSVR
jgi:tetratricopeptide (TPR) repeat protein